MSRVMTIYLIASLVILSVLLLFALVYAIVGRRFTDKIVGINMVGSLGVLATALLACLLDADYILDIALVFALLSFLTVVVLCRLVITDVRHNMHTGSEKEAEK